MKYLFASVLAGWPGLSPMECLPIGLAYVAAALRNTGRYVSGINFAWHTEPPKTLLYKIEYNDIKEPLNALLKKIEYEDIDVLCISGMSPDFVAVRETISIVRKNFPHIKIIIGGDIITTEPEFIVMHLDMDFGCVGYGEETICELAECLENNGDYSKIKGLIYRDESTGEFIINAERPQPECLDDIPFPALELFGFSGRNQCLPMLTARSCIGNCTFCYRIGGHKYMKRSMDNIFLEIDYWTEKYPISTIQFRDELFAIDKEAALDFCRRIKEYGISYIIFLRVDIVTEELIQALAESGCIGITYGIESIDQSVLNSMRKGTTVEQIEYALKITHKYNILPNGDLIFGDPAETYDIAKKTLEWWLRNTHYNIYLNMIRTLPGSALYKHGVETGRIKDKLNFLEGGCVPINLSAMSDAEYNKVKRQIWCFNGMTMTANNIRFESGTNDAVLICGDCPYCGAVNYADYLAGGFSSWLMHQPVCTECNSIMAFKLNFNYNYHELRYFNEFNFKDKKVVVWGLSEKAKFRLATNKVMRDAVVVIVDRNYNYFEDKFLEFKIQSPKVLLKTDFDVLYIGSNISRESILNMAREIVGSELYKKEIMIMD